MRNVIETENYVYDNGHYIAVFRIYIPYGRGMDITTNQARALFRPTQIEGCEVMTHQKSGNLTHAQMVSYLGDISKKGDISEELGGAHNNDDLRQNIIYSLPRDLAEYDKHKTDETYTIPQYHWSMVIYAETLEKLEKQIIRIQTDYKEGQEKEFTKWVILIPAISSTYNDLKKIFSENINHNDRDSDTITHENYSGLDFYETTTLQDRLGVPIGDDIYSSEVLVGSSTKRSKVVVDFHRNVMKQAIIANPREMGVPEYRLKPTKTEPNGSIAPLSSVMGQAIANQLIVEGKKVVHYNLNGFSYDRLENTREFIDQPAFYQKIKADEIIINGLQPFGLKEQEQLLYDSFKKKTTILFDIARNFTLTESDKLLIEEAVKHVYSEYWKKNALFRNLVNVKSELFKTYANLTEYLNTKMGEAEGIGDFNRKTQIEDLATSIQTVIGESNSFARRTTFEYPKTAELVIDCANISPKVAISQLVNTINFIVHNLEEGDAIFIHGTEIIPPEVFKEYLNTELQVQAFRKNIRVFYLFDTTFTNNNRSIEDYEGILFENFDKDFDIHFIGYTASENFSKVENLFHNKFNPQMKVDMTSDIWHGRGMFRRNRTKDSIMLDVRELLL